MTGLSVLGAAALTAGVTGWITGFCMGLADHGRWRAWSLAGEYLTLAGLACGLVLLALVAAWRRPPPPPTYPDLVLRAPRFPPERPFQAIPPEGGDYQWSR